MNNRLVDAAVAAHKALDVGDLKLVDLTEDERAVLPLYTAAFLAVDDLAGSRP